MVSLRHGRSLTIDDSAEVDVVEVRAPSGGLELRLQMTEDGVVVQIEASRISLKASESVDVECKTFNVNAAADVSIESAMNVRVQGERIYLN